MEYAFVHNGVGYTPSGKLVLSAERVPSHNAEMEAADLARIEAGAPVVVYPKHDEKTFNAGYYGIRQTGVVTLWTGKVVGVIVKLSTFRNPFGRVGLVHCSTLTAYTWRSTDGRIWHGRGAGSGMMLRSRPSKKG